MFCFIFLSNYATEMSRGKVKYLDTYFSVQEHSNFHFFFPQSHDRITYASNFFLLISIRLKYITLFMPRSIAKGRLQFGSIMKENCVEAITQI